MSFSEGLINTFWLILDDSELDQSEVPSTIDEVLEQAPTDGNDHSTLGSDKERQHVQRSTILKPLGGSTARKTERLVAWNTELLLQLLKHIVAKRNAISGRKMTQVALTAMAQNISTGGMVVEEVVEIIQLPDFDERLSSKKVDANAVMLSDDVISQTKRFVSLIASMYRDNPCKLYTVGRKVLLRPDDH